MAKVNEDNDDLDTNIEDTSEEDMDRGDVVEDPDDEDIDEGDAESEDESEEDGEEDDTDEEEEEAPKRGIKIPKYRLDQEIEKVKALKERESWLEQQLEKLINSKPDLKKELQEIKDEVEYDFDAAEEQYITHVLEGEPKEAIKLRKQIDAERTKIFRKTLELVRDEAAEKAISSSKSAKDDEKFQEYISNYESKYTFLNRAKKAYNEDAVDTINALMTGFMAKGVVRSEALKKAVEKVLPLYATPVKAPVDKRAVDQRKKNVSANNRQPPTMKGKSFKDVSIDDFDVSNLDDKEFAKMSKDKKSLAKLRGDIV